MPWHGPLHPRPPLPTLTSTSHLSFKSQPLPTQANIKLLCRSEPTVYQMKYSIVYCTPSPFLSSPKTCWWNKGLNQSVVGSPPQDKLIVWPFFFSQRVKKKNGNTLVMAHYRKYIFLHSPTALTTILSIFPFLISLFSLSLLYLSLSLSISLSLFLSHSSDS